MDIANFSSDARAVIKNAREVTLAFRHPEIEVEHLLIAAVRADSPGLETMLNQLGKSAAMFEGLAETYLKEQSSKKAARDSVGMSPSATNTLSDAVQVKGELMDALVEPEHIVIAIFDPKSNLAPYLREKLDVTREDFFRAIAESKSVEEITAAHTASGSSGASADSAPQSVSGTLKYCEDITNQAQAGQFDPVLGRDQEIQELIQILLRRRKNSPVLVGGAGVGKTAIVEGFAQAVIEDKVPQSLRGVKVMGLDMGSLVAGAKYKGEFEERFKNLVSEVVKSAGRIVLFIDEIHMLCGAGNSGGGMDAANLLKPALARGTIRVIGATTEEEYTKYLEADKALDRRFEKVKVAAPPFDDAVRIIRGVIPKYEEHHGVNYSDDAVVAAVRMATRYLAERNLPDIALDIVDEAASEYAVRSEFGREKVTEVESKVADLSSLLSSVSSDTPSPELVAAWEDYQTTYERLNALWGHRIDAADSGEAS